MIELLADVNEIAPAAGALSTYGLYAIVATLSLVVVYLYKRITELEKELRQHLITNSAETAKLLAQATNVIEDNAKAFQEFQSALVDVKTTVQFAMESRKS